MRRLNKVLDLLVRAIWQVRLCLVRGVLLLLVLLGVDLLLLIIRGNLIEAAEIPLSVRL